MGTKKPKIKKGRPTAAPKHKINDPIKFTGKILKKQGNSAVVKDLNEEPGTVKKIDGDHVYMDTNEGVLYLHQDKVVV